MTDRQAVGHLLQGCKVCLALHGVSRLTKLTDWLPWVDDAWRNLKVLTKRLEDDGMEMEQNGRKWMEMDGNIGGRNSKELKITKSDNVQHTQTPVYQHQLRRVKNPCMPGRPARGRVDSASSGYPNSNASQFQQISLEIPSKQLDKKNSYLLSATKKNWRKPSHHFRWMIFGL